MLNNNFISKALLVSSFLILFFYIGCKPAYEKTAPLFSNLGNHSYKVTANSELAQKYFNQGLIFTYGFNHAEAYRAFREASRLDSNCAMAYWGMALVLGPNINAPMEDTDVKTAYDAVQKALRLSDNVSEKERDFILALSKRYVEEPVEDRSSLDIAYADAMRVLAKKYPDDLDIQTFFAESIMNLHPWDYWLKDGTAQPWTPEILNTIEFVLERNPDHPGANHFYIHAVEASKNPEKGLPSADRLLTLVPGAGHLVHMPAHIYINTGDYSKGTYANQLAVQADEAYLTECRKQGIYPIGYYPHNYHFLWACASLEGRSEIAIEAAYKTATVFVDTLMMMCGYGTLQHYSVIPYYSYIRFGKWDQILKEADLPIERFYPRAIRHYARGMAYIAKNMIDEAGTELNMLELIAAGNEIENVSIWGINSVRDLLNISVEILKGEIAAKQKDVDKAIIHLTKAVDLEEALAYNEPPDWFYPARHNLGSVLIDAGRFKEAEKVYRDDLSEFPKNGWSLFGLMQALKGQNKNDEAEDIKKQFNEAWKNADVQLTSSRIL